MAQDNYPISVRFKNGCSVETKPDKLKVRKSGTPATIVVTWTAEKGATFPQDNYFQWKPGAFAAPPTPQRVNDTTLQLTYPAPSSKVPAIWPYTISITNATCGTQSEDPTIDNEPPIEEGPKPKKGSGRGKRGKRGGALAVRPTPSSGKKSAAKKKPAAKKAAAKKKPAAKKRAPAKKRPAAKKASSSKKSSKKSSRKSGKKSARKK